MRKRSLQTFPMPRFLFFWFSPGIKISSFPHLKSGDRANFNRGTISARKVEERRPGKPPQNVAEIFLQIFSAIGGKRELRVRSSGRLSNNLGHEESKTGDDTARQLISQDDCQQILPKKGVCLCQKESSSFFWKSQKMNCHSTMKEIQEPCVQISR